MYVLCKIYLSLMCMKKWIGTVRYYTSLEEVGMEITVILNRFH